jgi:hypothetical protein
MGEKPAVIRTAPSYELDSIPIIPLLLILENVVCPTTYEQLVQHFEGEVAITAQKQCHDGRAGTERHQESKRNKTRPYQRPYHSDSVPEENGLIGSPCCRIRLFATLQFIVDASAFKPRSG